MLAVTLALIMGTAIGLRGGAVSIVLFGCAICGLAALAFILASGITLSGILALGCAILGYNLGLALGLAAALKPVRAA